MNLRTQLRPAGHPDLYTIKFSLAELLETSGDEESTNALRQEIVDTTIHRQKMIVTVVPALFK
jgi:hypothetical protein